MIETFKTCDDNELAESPLHKYDSLRVYFVRKRPVKSTDKENIMISLIL